MNSPTTAIVIVVLILLSYRLMHTIFVRRLQRGEGFRLRSLPSLALFKQQIGLAVESGRQMHITMGQAGVHGPASPTSLAALNVLGYLADEGCANDAPPLVTTGEGTLLLAAQEKMRQSLASANRADAYHSHMVHFVAHHTDPYAYAGGVSAIIHQDEVTGNVMVGQFGPELVLMAEAAERQGVTQVIGTDDPTAMALATAVTENSLIGEELFAAAAYLQQSADQIAALRIQDILRFLTIVAILIWAIAHLIR